MLETNFVIIDSQVNNYQQLVRGINPNQKVEVFILDRDRDGILQISEILFNRDNFVRVHLISHGSPGCLYFGNTKLNLFNLETYTSQLQTWFAPPTLSRTPLIRAAGGIEISSSTVVKWQQEMQEKNLLPSSKNSRGQTLQLRLI